MTATTSGRSLVRIAALPRGFVRRVGPAAIIAIAMIAIFSYIAILRPALLTYPNLSGLFATAAPLVFATLAQLIIMSIGDIDLGIGFFIGLVSAVSATLLSTDTLLGIVALAVLVLGYAGVGYLVQVRSVPSLVATLGASFIWLGLGLLLLPIPGGAVLEWLRSLETWLPPIVPVPVVIIVVAVALVWLITQRTTFGVRIRALGSNPMVVTRAGYSLATTRALAYGLAGVLGVCGGLVMSAKIGSGNVAAGDGYTLLSIAAVILGGGTFSGGRAPVWGALFGALTLSFVVTLLTILRVPGEIQSAVQAAIIFAALAGRIVIERVAKS